MILSKECSKWKGSAVILQGQNTLLNSNVKPLECKMDHQSAKSNWYQSLIGIKICIDWQL